MPTPTNPPVPSGMDPLVIYTFEWWTVKAGDVTGTVPEDNLTYLNLAIAWSAAKGIPIYGLKGNYRIRPTPGSPYLNLVAGARVFCAPGCVISWDAAPPSGTPGLVHSPTGSSGAHWIGGEWTPVLRGVYPLGDVFNVTGNDMLFERVIVTDHRAGRAFAVSGNRNSIVKPTITSTKLNADGVRVNGGSGFRCLDGTIDVTGDAVLISPSGTATETSAINDSAVLGTKLASSGGSLVAIETAYQATSSGFVRGAMTGAQSDTTPASNAVAAKFTSSARGCYVEEANLAAIGSDVSTSKIDVSAAVDYRLTANYGSAQQTTTVGAQVEVTIASTATTIAPKASFVKVKITGGASATLTSIAAGRDGDLLVLGTSMTSQTLNVSDTGNLKLNGACALASPNDTVTLLARGTDWVELARSING